MRDTMSVRPLARKQRTARRVAAVVGAAYVAALVVFHGALLAGVVVARVQGRHPQAPGSIDLENVRRIDDRVWASSQPAARNYRELATAGVEMIVDLRTGAADDPNEVDRTELARLGIGYVKLPVPDGHVPDQATVRRFLELVEGQNGLVLVHCGAGVGRSSTLAAAYLSYQGRDVSLWDTLAMGPVTLEQGWYLTTGQGNEVIRRLSETLDAPRRGWSRLRSLL